MNEFKIENKFLTLYTGHLIAAISFNDIISPLSKVTGNIGLKIMTGLAKWGALLTLRYIFDTPEVIYDESSTSSIRSMSIYSNRA